MPPEIGFGRAIRGTVVISKIEVRDAEVKGPAQDCILLVEALVITEVVPQAQ
ncbi:hypothetical protein D3C74_438560 [compost metagenome]